MSVVLVPYTGHMHTFMKHFQPGVITGLFYYPDMHSDMIDG